MKERYYQMSIKSRTIKAVKDAATEYAKAAGKVAEINKNAMLSTAGKIHEVLLIEEQFAAYIESSTKEYDALMLEAIKAVGQTEAMSFSNANLGFVHAIAHTLSAHFGLAHGMANACVLPYVMAYNAEACPEKMVELAKAIGLTTSGDIEKDKFLLSDALLALCRKLGIRTLKEQNVPEEAFDRLSDDVLKEPVLGFNPRQGVTKEDVIEILKKAY